MSKWSVVTCWCGLDQCADAAHIEAAPDGWSHVCKWCGDPVPANYVFCDSDCLMARKRERRKGRLERGEIVRPVRVSFRPQVRLFVYERDGWICRLCFQPVDREAPVGSPERASLDHIIPLSEGGAKRAVSNLRLTHVRCNSARGVQMNTARQILAEYLQ